MHSRRSRTFIISYTSNVLIRRIAPSKANYCRVLLNVEYCLLRWTSNSSLRYILCQNILWFRSFHFKVYYDVRIFVKSKFCAGHIDMLQCICLAYNMLTFVLDVRFTLKLHDPRIITKLELCSTFRSRAVCLIYV